MKRRSVRPRKRVKKKSILSNKERMELIAIVNAIKSGPCPDCGRTYDPCAVDLDHLDGFKKSFTISEFLRGPLPENAKDLLEAELKKVQAVCSNCHRVRTKNRAQGKVIKKSKPFWW
jgi:hypothetical protein